MTMISEMRDVKTMRSMPRRLNSEMRALIPFKLNTTKTERQDHDIGNERCKDNAQHAAQADLRDARTDPLQTEHHLDRKAMIMISEMRDVKNMRSMPRRLNSEMRALIPFKLNTI
jgi:hypothetical protein